MFTDDDLKQIAAQGLSLSQVERQILDFKDGFPFLKIESAASIGNGIVVFDDDDTRKFLISLWDKYRCEGKDDKDGRIYKFVPASGAATRMFKALFEFADSYDGGGLSSLTPTAIAEFFTNIEYFAFYSDLDNVLRVKEGQSVRELMAENRHDVVVRYLLGPCGLNFGSRPKGIFPFHKYKDCIRTAVEEHLVEALQYAGNKKREVNIHYTVSPEHLQDFQKLMGRVVPMYEQRFDAQINVSFSTQKQSTDTIAVTVEDEPFRNEDGSLLFRPGGHGALIENLNDLDAGVVFIRNIDNVVPDAHKGSVVYYEKLMAGLSIRIRGEVDELLRRIECSQMGGGDDEALFEDLAAYFTKILQIKLPEAFAEWTAEERLAYFSRKLRRPIRICGMVRNEGEPGGGPYYCYSADGSCELQILESSQIDKSCGEYRLMQLSSTHFNPVDIVCNFQGEHYNLLDYVDNSCGFISLKSKNGRTLKALELPGLWNGAMSDWISIFVEIPLANFNPVKTINDLLRPQHQM